MYSIIFSPNFPESKRKLEKENSKLLAKVLTLILELAENPFV